MRSLPHGITVVALSLFAATGLADPTADGTTPTKHEKPAGKRHTKGTPPTADNQHGNASFYARHFSGRKTASGARYDPGALTAAHRTLPMGTQVKVTNPKNDQSVVVTVNDRGPVPKDRMIDVSSAAASKLGMTKSGVTPVETQVVGKGDAAKGDAR